jgi:hypothetical protein
MSCWFMSGGQAQRSISHDVGRLLASLVVGDPMADFGGDAYVPLLARDDGRDADLLEEGLARGETTLREVGDGGEVGKVQLRHLGKRMLLLLDGEQIVGAKQNRVFNASFLVAPESEVELPVSCVERGRWRHDGREFSASEVTLTGTARSRKLSRVTMSALRGEGYDAHQASVWADVDTYLEQSRVVSRTSAMNDAIADKQAHTKTKLLQLAPRDGQVGVALVRDGRVVLMDLFGSARLYARAHRKVLGGMLADAGGAREPTTSARAIVARTLGDVAALSLVAQRAPGCGYTLHGESSTLALGAVAHDGRVYHAVIAATG